MGTEVLVMVTEDLVHVRLQHRQLLNRYTQDPLISDPCQCITAAYIHPCDYQQYGVLWSALISFVQWLISIGITCPMERLTRTYPSAADPTQLQ